MPPFSVGRETASLCLSTGWPNKSFIRWMQMRHVRCQEKEKFHERNSQKASTHSTTADAKVKCRPCEGTHKVKTCKTCKETAVKGTWEITQKNKLCYRCLGPGHLGNACQGSNRWNVDNWGGTHHFHLHVECQERASEHNRKGEIATVHLEPLETASKPQKVWCCGQCLSGFLKQEGRGFRVTPS